MGGDGYSNESDFETFFNVDINSARFTLMNKKIARKINQYVNDDPSIDVSSTYTNTARDISDELLMTLWNFFKESSMENPPEFIHYKLPHFTPDHKLELDKMKMLLGHIGDIGTGE